MANKIDYTFMEMSNLREKPVYVEELNKETIGIEIELWPLERGIKSQ